MEWTTVYATSLRGNAVHLFYAKRGLIHVSYLHACHEFSIITLPNISQFCLHPAKYIYIYAVLWPIVSELTLLMYCLQCLFIFYCQEWVIRNTGTAVSTNRVCDAKENI